MCPPLSRAGACACRPRFDQDKKLLMSFFKEYTDIIPKKVIKNEINILDLIGDFATAYVFDVCVCACVRVRSFCW